MPAGAKYFHTCAHCLAETGSGEQGAAGVDSTAQGLGVHNRHLGSVPGRYFWLFLAVRWYMFLLLYKAATSV